MPERHDEGRRLSLTPEQVAARRAEFERRNRAARRAEAENPGPPATLGQVRENTEWSWIDCARPGCSHTAAVPIAPLIIRWGPDAPWDYIRKAFRCTRCGFKGVTTTMPSWAGADVGFAPIREHSRWTGKAVWPCEISNVLDDRAFAFQPNQFFHPVLGIINFAAMCNLYSQTRSRDEIRGLFRVSDNRAYAIEPLPAIFPRTVAPIVRLAADGERELVPATWGYPLIRKGYAPKPVTNVRDDTALSSPFWRPSLDARRCLVPASSYCEPDSNKPAGWHWFALTSGALQLPTPSAQPRADGADADVGIRSADQERPLFAFPGIWKRYTGPVKKDGPEVEIDVYAFLTTAPNALTATIMHDRMPVLLSEPDDFEVWLTAPTEEAFRLVRTYAADRMRIVQSGNEKRDLLGVADGI